MAARASMLARHALRYGCTVPEVRAMTPREVRAMDDLLDERDRERALAAARESAKSQARGRMRHR